MAPGSKVAQFCGLAVALATLESVQLPMACQPFPGCLYQGEPVCKTKNVHGNLNFTNRKDSTFVKYEGRKYYQMATNAKVKNDVRYMLSMKLSCEF